MAEINNTIPSVTRRNFFGRNTPIKTRNLFLDTQSGMRFLLSVEIPKRGARGCYPHHPDSNHCTTNQRRGINND